MSDVNLILLYKKNKYCNMNNLRKMNYPFKDGGALTANDMNIIGGALESLGYISKDGKELGKLIATDAQEHIHTGIYADIDFSQLFDGSFPVRVTKKNEDGVEEKVFVEYINFKDTPCNGLTIRLPFNYCDWKPNTHYKSCARLTEVIEEDKSIMQFPFPITTIANAIPQDIANMGGTFHTFKFKIFGQELTFPTVMSTNDTTYDDMPYKVNFDLSSIGLTGLLSPIFGLPIHISLYFKEDPTIENNQNKVVRAKASITVAGLDLLIDGMPIETLAKLIAGFRYGAELWAGINRNSNMTEEELAIRKEELRTEVPAMIEQLIEDAAKYGLYSDGIDLIVLGSYTSTHMHSFMISLLGLDEVNISETETDALLNGVGYNISIIPGTNKNVEPEILLPFGPIMWLPGEIVENVDENKDIYPYVLPVKEVPYNFYSYASEEDLLTGTPTEGMKSSISFNIYLKDDKKFSNGKVIATVSSQFSGEEQPVVQTIHLHAILLNSTESYQNVKDTVKEFRMRMLPTLPIIASLLSSGTPEFIMELLNSLSLTTNIPYVKNDRSIEAESKPASFIDITIKDGIADFDSTFIANAINFDLISAFLPNN